MSHNYLLPILGVLAVGAFALSCDSDIRENYMIPGVSMRADMEKVIGTQAGPGKDIKLSLNYADYPMKPDRTMTINPYEPIKEPYSVQSPAMLGSGAATSSPYVSYPSYQQSTPLVSPSIPQLPAAIKYKPPSLDQMGITETYKCMPSNMRQATRENYMDSNVAGGIMDAKVDPANPWPGPDFAAGNYAKAAGSTPCINPQSVEGVQVGNISLATPSGATQQVMVFDRPMTTTLKAGRTNMRGVIDYIRGDIPVCVDASQKGWFQASAKPTDLYTGSLAAIAGTNESTATLANMMKTYGSSMQTAGGINLSQYPSSQQTVPQQMLSMNTGAGGNTTVVAFT